MNSFQLEKSLTIGPITALYYHHEESDDDNERGILFVGIGGILQVIRNIFTTNCSTTTTSISISDIDSIFGIKYIDKEIYNDDVNKILIFGGKSIHILEFKRNNDNMDIVIRYKLNQLDDLVLDSSLIRDESKIYLIIGYAHNFIDIVLIENTEDKTRSSLNNFLKRRIQCSDICCLFSMAFNVDNVDNILIASGTVFGKIIVWKVNNDNTFDIMHRLNGHEGVVFNIKWNDSRDKIATVSDDRSVRVWDIIMGKIIFVGWGHICRPWDSIFITNIDNKELVLTSSEEGVIKVWDIKANKCISNLRGHSSDIWRLLYLKHQRVLISGGNDGSIKFWYLKSYLLSCPDDLESTAKRLQIPRRSSDDITKENSSRRNNGISFVRISDNGNFIVVGFVEGRICTVMNSTENSSDMNWSEIICLDNHITCGDVCFRASNEMIILCGHIYGSVSILFVEKRENKWNCIITAFEGHPLRIINIWFIHPDDNVHDYTITFFTASVKGHNKLWNISISTDSQTANILSSNECFTVSKQVATNSIITNSSVTTARFLIVGDTRGNIGIYNSDSMELLQHIYKAHGPDQLPISHFASYHGGFYSLGHDGFLNRYEEVSCIENDSIYTLASTLSCLPLKTPDQIITCGDAKNHSIYVCGYLGNVFIVWDVRNCHQLMRVEGGSWKRSHHCVIAFIKSPENLILPRVVFACSLPTGTDTELMINDSLCQPYEGVIYEKDIGSSISIPLHVGYPSFGKVGYCTIILNIGTSVSLKYILIGGEEGTVKVYNTSDNRHQFTFCEDLVMPFNAAVRALEKLHYDKDHGLVIAGGGRLIYSIWKYSYHARATSNNFSLICSGTILPNASQDHRILSISSYNIECYKDNNVGHFIVFGDSRGIVTISEVNKASLKIVNDISISSNGYPILSAKAITYNNNSTQCIIGSFGDTTGNVSILLLYYAFLNIERVTPFRLYTYNAHSMGANTLDMILINTDAKMLKFKICSGGDDQSITVCNGLLSFDTTNTESFKVSLDIHNVEVLEGGSGSALKGLKLINATNNLKDPLIISIGYDRRLSIWSIIEGHYDDDIVLYSIEYDDTIFDNNYSNMLLADDSIVKKCTKLNLNWLQGSMVDIGDIGSIDTVIDDSKVDDDDITRTRISIAVVGEGFQYLILNS